MTCGAPIITSDRSAIPEVLGDAGWLIDAEDDTALRDYLLRLINNPNEREELRKRGFVRVKAFKWDEIAKKTLALYASVLKPTHHKI